VWWAPPLTFFMVVSPAPSLTLGSVPRAWSGRGGGAFSLTSPGSPPCRCTFSSLHSPRAPLPAVTSASWVYGDPSDLLGILNHREHISQRSLPRGKDPGPWCALKTPWAGQPGLWGSLQMCPHHTGRTVAAALPPQPCGALRAGSSKLTCTPKVSGAPSQLPTTLTVVSSSQM
jgi:hypothetical protein